MSMHGRGMTRSSFTCTVFSSMNRPPQSHEATMFWLSCVCGPAEGPMGVSRRLPKSSLTSVARASVLVAQASVLARSVAPASVPARSPWRKPPCLRGE